jgi:uncharacterized protein YqeY
MSLHTDIKASLKDAMKAKEAVRLRVIRSLLTAFMNELVATKRTPQDELTDDEVMAVIKRAAKQRKESISQYEAAGRQDLADPEKEELAIIEEYLPALMSREDIAKVVAAKKAELGIDDKSKMGMLVGAVMKELGGQADGADVKVEVEASFE